MPTEASHERHRRGTQATAFTSPEQARAAVEALEHRIVHVDRNFTPAVSMDLNDEVAAVAGCSEPPD
jgi:hypothetical protein